MGFITVAGLATTIRMTGQSVYSFLESLFLPYEWWIHNQRSNIGKAVVPLEKQDVVNLEPKMYEVQRGNLRSWMAAQVFEALEEGFAKKKCHATEILCHLSSKKPGSDFDLRVDYHDYVNPPSEREALALYLLNKGATIEHSEDEQHVELVNAASCGNVALVKILCNEQGNIEATDNQWKQTALSKACEKGHITVVEYLCDQNCNIEALDDHAKTPLIYAARYGHLQIVQLLCQRGADIEARNVSGTNALMYAAKKGHESTVRFLCDQGPNIDAQDYWGATALMYATRGAYTVVVNYLCGLGANLDVRDELGNNAFLDAADSGMVSVVQTLCDQGADINSFAEKEDRAGLNALMIASKANNAHLVQFLCKRGANVNAANDQSLTALMYACREGHARIVQLLCAQGARVIARTRDNTTAMDEVDESGEWSEPIQQILKKHIRKDDDEDHASIFSSASVVTVPSTS